MKLRFTSQQYQSDAVDAVTGVFTGQGNSESISYTVDPGRWRDKLGTQSLIGLEEALGQRNAPIKLDSDSILKNIQVMQANNGLPTDKKLVSKTANVELDVEMETGTGKTYVYTKSMLELNKKYGWTKFIIVVPSVAIREGTYKSLKLTEEHFAEEYGKRLQYFVYDSKNLMQLDDFARSSDITAMIINMQAFNSSFKEGAKNESARIIFDVRDDFGGRRPIDVVAATNPIVIVDEPQKMGGARGKTMKALERFNPLFIVNFSATHKEKHNLVYALDPVDAYNQRLVKRIEVKGIEVRNGRSTDPYLYLKEFQLSPDKAPLARIEFNYMSSSGQIRKKSHLFGEGDDICVATGDTQLEAYRGFVIASGNDGIVPGTEDEEGYVRFLNGVEIRRGEVFGDSIEKDLRRIQIRETIDSHLEKEEQLFNKGIKCLSLFFIDEVAKYRDVENPDQSAVYAALFEEEYQRAVQARLANLRSDDSVNPGYIRYLERFQPRDVHLGYFSVDSKGRLVDTKETSAGANDANATRAYDLILKDKERLLSFDEPVRFIFSHSALREGWDNPNIFQICTLKNSSSEISKRQEIGRGLRLAVDASGIRQDQTNLPIDRVHELNLLTVIASESYSNFVKDLQTDLAKELRPRPKAVSKDFFAAPGKVVVKRTGEEVEFTKQQSQVIHDFLRSNDLLDEHNRPTEKFRTHGLSKVDEASLPGALKTSTARDAVETMVMSVEDDNVIAMMFENAGRAKATNKLNANARKQAFLDLWERINHKYAYTVEFSDEEFQSNAVAAIDRELSVTPLMVTVTKGKQSTDLTEDAVLNRKAFGAGGITPRSVAVEDDSQVRYDLVGEVAAAAQITRRSAASILQKIKPDKFAMFRFNPEEFIAKVANIILAQKATAIVEHVAYHPLEDRYDQSIFTEDLTAAVDRAVEAKKSIQPYVVCDSKIERQFVEDLDASPIVEVFAKLPRAFKIPTPVGDYAPDWAIAFTKGTVKHIFFVAETKGTLNSLELSSVEQTKIACAKKLFAGLADQDVKYHHVATYRDLLEHVGVVEA